MLRGCLPVSFVLLSWELRMRERGGEDKGGN